MAPVNTVESLEQRNAEIAQEIETIDKDHAGELLPADVKERWNSLNDERDANLELIRELEARMQRISDLTGSKGHAEPTQPARQTSRRASRVPENVHDVAAYRANTSSDDEFRTALRDGAKKVIDGLTFPDPQADAARTKDFIAGLVDHADTKDGEFARRVLHTASPTYERAFGKFLAGIHRTQEEERVLAVGGQGGNYPVPITLDPTVILTSTGVVNPLRQISRVVNVTGNVWYGVASGGITAAYSAELTETTDNSPTLTQPSANVEKAQAFVPFSIEAGEDWQGLQADMARMLRDAKDNLEATKFLSGAGHGSKEPQGLLVGATAVVTTASTAVFAIADLYSLVEALPERWQPNASILAHRHQLNKVRQFDSSGGANLWVQLGAGTPNRLLDYPTYPYSAMSSANTTGASIATIGDFSQFLILDRVGLNIELIPHLFGTARIMPNGSRGLYAYWRNTSVVLTVDAFRTLKLL